MTASSELTSWVERYLTAWTSNDPDDIRALFTEDAEYRYHPWDDPVTGHEAIVASWLESQDAPEDWTYEWQAVAEQGPTRVVDGRAVYTSGNVYRTMWVVELGEDGRASRFTEWPMTEPTDPPTAA
ncbi:nuclear transport factor 2 family protein [Naasia sp. SYSU D00057]|uniref:nuclear transport factor 2 family protein n=1 Tax=Naasia sp. SYSU D00057 TaxID=2817380 RepID=UPI001B3014DD|nr:nuclear transport factor 2 family protein [Naasia sp. SYSU D00057]